MIILKHAAAVSSYIKSRKDAGLTIGFVPTMGALHQGHISLLNESKKLCNITIMSIFINPTQFNSKEDFKKYPVTIENDIYLLEKNKCDILFLPDVNEIYPDGIKSTENFDLGYLDTILEGQYRPGHFGGVCQVVKRLLEITHPTHLFLGQKDYQQCMVIKKLLEIMHSNIHLQICETLREPNGLAMSSRNARLNEIQKEQALEIYNTLNSLKKNIVAGNLNTFKKKAIEHLLCKGFRPDYVEIADADNLHLLEKWNGKDDLVILIAAFLGDVRLIDNLTLTD